MEPRTVGRCGLRVSPVGLGTAGWGMLTEAAEALEITHAFLDSAAAGGGPVLLDTSPAYGSGGAEEVVGRVLGAVPREQVVVSSAAGVDPAAPLGRRVDCSRRSLMHQLERSLTRLGTDYLDIWSIGYWDRLTPPAEVTATIRSVVAAGKVRYAAVRDYTGWQLALTAVDCPEIIAVQTEYSLLLRGCEEHLLPAAQYLGLGVIAAAPLARGLLTAPRRPKVRADAHPLLGPRTTTIVEALQTAAEGLAVTPAVAALSWVLDRPGVVASLVGPRTLDQARELLACAARPLPGAIASALDDVSA